ncbi:MAG: putative 3-demethylubiquinol 3-O-methyltransferase, partial [Bradyrhizobium sp.]|nr:putative 3-demethylubiquinol 3-O-methyltransferase [Bradyrhizobium sp.]
NIEGEARAFDLQIEERMANGHIPDLRRAPVCEYFYNNPWRHPEYVKLDFGQIFERIDNAIRRSGPQKGRARVMEIGCGPGFISLELARAGHDVLGLDVSSKAIAIAKSVASTDPWISERGPLEYRVADFLADDDLVRASFDCVVTVGALHHCPDQDGVGARVRDLLRPEGIFIVQEPTRDRYTRGLATFVHMVRLLLSSGGGFYQNLSIPTGQIQLEAEIDKIFKSLRYEGECGEKLQSPNDNEAGYSEMHAMLSRSFHTVTLQDTSAFFHELIGGLRFDETTNTKLARYIRDIDTLLVHEKVLPATEFFFVGKNRT